MISAFSVEKDEKAARLRLSGFPLKLGKSKSLLQEILKEEVVMYRNPTKIVEGGWFSSNLNVQAAKRQHSVTVLAFCKHGF